MVWYDLYQMLKAKLHCVETQYVRNESDAENSVFVIEGQRFLIGITYHTKIDQTQSLASTSTGHLPCPRIELVQSETHNYPGQYYLYDLCGRHHKFATPISKPIGFPNSHETPNSIFFPS